MKPCWRHADVTADPRTLKGAPTVPVLYLERMDNPHNECVYQGRLNTAPVLSGQVPSRSLAHPVSRLFAAVGSGGPFR